MRVTKPLLVGGLLLVAAAVPGCRTHAQSGALIGGLVGAGAGQAVGHNRGHRTNHALAGAALGALGGYLIGDSMDSAERDARYDGPRTIRGGEEVVVRERVYVREEPAPVYRERIVVRETCPPPVYRERVIVRDRCDPRCGW